MSAPATAAGAIAEVAADHSFAACWKVVSDPFPGVAGAPAVYIRFDYSGDGAPRGQFVIIRVLMDEKVTTTSAVRRRENACGMYYELQCKPFDTSVAANATTADSDADDGDVDTDGEATRAAPYLWESLPRHAIKPEEANEASGAAVAVFQIDPLLCAAALLSESVDRLYAPDRFAPKQCVDFEVTDVTNPSRAARICDLACVQMYHRREARRAAANEINTATTTAGTAVTAAFDPLSGTGTYASDETMTLFFCIGSWYRLHENDDGGWIIPVSRASLTLAHPNKSNEPECYSVAPQPATIVWSATPYDDGYLQHAPFVLIPFISAKHQLIRSQSVSAGTKTGGGGGIGIADWIPLRQSEWREQFRRFVIARYAPVLDIGGGSGISVGSGICALIADYVTVIEWELYELNWRRNVFG